MAGSRLDRKPPGEAGGFSVCAGLDLPLRPGQSTNVAGSMAGEWHLLAVPDRQCGGAGRSDDGPWRHEQGRAIAVA